MGLLNKLKSMLAGKPATETDPEDAALFEQIITVTWTEYIVTHEPYYIYDFNLNETPTWTKEVSKWEPPKKVAFMLWLIEQIQDYNAKGGDQWEFGNTTPKYHLLRKAYLKALFKGKLVLTDGDVADVYAAFRAEKIRMWDLYTMWPTAALLSFIEKKQKNGVLSPVLLQVLQHMKKDVAGFDASAGDKERFKFGERIEVLLFGATPAGETTVKPVHFLGKDAFSGGANDAIAQLPEAERNHWYALLQLAQTASGGKPSNKYLKTAKEIIEKLGEAKFQKMVQHWFGFLVQMKRSEEAKSVGYENGSGYHYLNANFLSSINAEAVKGLVWMCTQVADSATIQVVAALADRAFKKIPGVGATSALIGNACLYTLYATKKLEAIGQLSRLKLRVKTNNTQALIDKYLLAAAEEQGVTISEIEDMAVEDCGLVAGRREILFGDYKAELLITGVGKTETKWYKPDGSLQKSVPASVKTDFAAELKALKATQKQTEQTLVAQRDRLDRMFRAGRMLSPEAFRKYYFEHGLMSFLTTRLIWDFHLEGDKKVAAIFLGDHWVNAENEIVDLENYTGVSLWHPVLSTVAGVKAWREFMVFHQLQQPLKQAYREVYILTDAELKTKSYSNRMAAHILRQHQFNSLAKTRGWRYTLMGAFDNGVESEIAQLELPEYQLRAEYWVSEVNADNAMNDTGIWNYVSTDQLRFTRITEDRMESPVVDLVDVPPLAFSEVMRDADLFVGVASVGNDPTWADSAGMPVYRDYWQSYSFGDLSEVAKNRKEILAGLVPRIKIKNVARIQDKFLVVQGTIRTYKIHIGSTNILMEPNDEYLCIVPDRSPKSHTENLFLPFEGDGGLSVILSKAFMLAEDDKITDPTIVSQINRR